MVLATYEERLANGDVEIKDVVVSKRITREPRDYQKAGVTAIATQQLFGSGIKLRPGQNIEYIITDSQSAVPNDRVRAFALWEGWLGYDREKYATMLREAFQPFELFLTEQAPRDESSPDSGWGGLGRYAAFLQPWIAASPHLA
jgi:DNA polymerase elongation subunit (family B)